MQRGIIGSVCFLAFLLSIGKAEDLTAQEDPKIGDTRVAFENEDEEARSGPFVESSAFSDRSSSQSGSIAESSAGPSSAKSSASPSFGYRSSSSTNSKARGDSEAKGTSSSALNNNLYQLQGSNLAQGTAEVQTSSAYKSPEYSLLYPKYSEMKSIPNFALSSAGYPQAKEETEAVSGSLLYNEQSPYSSSSSFPYSSSLNLAQATLEPDAQVLSPFSPFFPYDVRISPAQAQTEFNTKGLSGSPYSYGQGLNYYSYNQDEQTNNAAALSGVRNPIAISPNVLQSSVPSITLNDDRGNLLNAGSSQFSPYNLDASYAKIQADAQATAANKYFNIYSPHILSSLNSAESSIDTTTQSNSHGNFPYGQMLDPYYPSSSHRYNPASQSNDISNPYNSEVNPFYLPPQNSPYNSGSSSASASSEAIANSVAKAPYNTPMDLPFPLEASAQDLVEAKGAFISGENHYNQGFVPSGYYISGSTAPSQATSLASDSSTLVNEFADANYRLLQPHEYVYPNKFPGNENQLQCIRLHEISYMWTSMYECLICICVSDSYSGLQPICAPCAGCQAPTRLPNPPSPPEPPNLQPIGPLQPEPYPIVSTPTPVLEVPITCNPLPTGRPFTNPLNPCQLCVCTESISLLGKPDVQIECQENPQCVLPPDVTTLPPVPENPVPVPLAMCEKFPPHVLFPHPSDKCKICKCSVELSEYGLPEQQITCYPDPECLVPSPDPVLATEPSPQPFQDIITVEPMIPWSPITTPAPPPPGPHLGPLPGPSPHESCRPFVANQPFQHPWDECQMCVCSEAYSVGMVNIEINCFTKKSCCIETPDNFISVTLPSPTSLSPVPHQAPDKIIIKDSLCELRSFLTEFLHPNDNCQVCVCTLTGNVVSATCKQTSTPRCLSYQSGSTNSETQAANEVYNGLQQTVPAGYRPPAITSYPTGGSKMQSIANDNANPIVPSSQQIYLPSYQSGRPIVYTGNQAEVQSQAQSSNGQSIASAESEANSEYNQNQLANYNMISGNYDQQGFNFGTVPDQISNLGSQVLGSQFKNPGYGIYNNLENLVNGFSGLTNYKQYNPTLYQGISASAMHPSLHSRPSYQVSPLYQIGQFQASTSQAEAQNTASGSNAQSQASASSGIDRFKTKIGLNGELMARL